MTDVRPPRHGETPLSADERRVVIRNGIKPARFVGASIAIQGRLYAHGAKRVIAMETGRFVRVGVLDEGRPWFTSFFLTQAAELSPLPMRYHGGQLP